MEGNMDIRYVKYVLECARRMQTFNNKTYLEEIIRVMSTEEARLEGRKPPEMNMNHKPWRSKAG